MIKFHRLRFVLNFFEPVQGYFYHLCNFLILFEFVNWIRFSLWHFKYVIRVWNLHTCFWVIMCVIKKNILLLCTSSFRISYETNSNDANAVWKWLLLWLVFFKFFFNGKIYHFYQIFNYTIYWFYQNLLKKLNFVNTKYGLNVEVNVSFERTFFYVQAQIPSPFQKGQIPHQDWRRISVW